MQHHRSQITRDNIRHVSSRTTQAQVAAYAAATFGPQHILHRVFPKKDPVVLQDTMTLLAGFALTDLAQVHMLTGMAVFQPKINSINCTEKLVKDGWSVELSSITKVVEEKPEIVSTIIYARAEQAFEVEVSMGVPKLKPKDPKTIECIGEHYTIAKYVEFASVLSVVLGGFLCLKNGDISYGNFDMKAFDMGGLSSIFVKEKFNGAVGIIMANLDELWRRFLPQTMRSTGDRGATMYGPTFSAAVYDVLMAAIDHDYRSETPRNRRLLGPIADAVNLCSKPLKGRDGTRQLQFDILTWGFSPAPCGLPTSIGNKSYDWSKNASFTLSGALDVLTKSRAVRGADKKEKSAFSRMSYLGYLLTTEIAETLYLASNLSRFLSEMTTIIIWDDEGKSLGAVLDAMNVICYDGQTAFTIKCPIPTDIMARIDVVKHKTHDEYWNKQRTVEIKNCSIMESLAAISTGEIVLDMRKLHKGTWNGPDKHLDWEISVETSLLNRLREYKSCLGGRQVIFRAPLTDFIRSYHSGGWTSQKEACKMLVDIKDSIPSLTHEDDPENIIIEVPHINLYSQVELHNGVGWFVIGYEPTAWFDDEDDDPTYYDLSQYNEWCYAMIVANMARNQYPYTRVNPCKRLAMKGLRPPYVPRQFVSRVQIVPLFHVYDEDELGTLSGMTDDELRRALEDIDNPGERAAAIAQVADYRVNNAPRDKLPDRPVSPQQGGSGRRQMMTGDNDYDDLDEDEDLDDNGRPIKKKKVPNNKKKKEWTKKVKSDQVD